MHEQQPPNHGKLTLADARRLTPPVEPVEAMRRQLAVSVYGAVKESDVEQMVAKLKEMALGGDHRAMKMYFELIGVMGKNQPAAPLPPPSPPPESAAGLKAVAESLRDLVDEIRIGKAVQAKADRLTLPKGDDGHV